MLNRFRRAPGPGVVRPIRKAAVTALIYVVLCSGYIFLSSHLAARSARSTEELEVIETAKGVGFIAVTGGLFFAISLARWRRIRIQEELLVQSERRNVAAMCAETLAHDLNNLLMSLTGLIEALKGKERDEEFVQTIREELKHGMGTLSRIAKSVASSARQLQPNDREEVDLQGVAERTAALVRKHPAVGTCMIEVAEGPSVWMPLHVGLLEQAIMNLLLNAAQAAGPRGRVQVALRKDGNALALEVHDTGPGVKSDQLSKLFEPGYSTKPEGTGLGLLAVNAFAASCEGEVRVEKSPLGGALFRLMIPMTSSW